jgi:hypothetical protein
MVVHERQIRVRLQVLTGCRDAIAAGAHTGLSEALGVQIANEARRLLAYEAYRERARRLTEFGSPPEPHSGWSYAPNAITLVRQLPEYQCSMIAGECKYFAAPWRLGELEPCGLRNHAYSGVLSAWTENELLASLERRAGT